jgi:hypothetical protein
VVWREFALLDFGFLELDMLAHDGIIFLEDELLGLGPRVLLGDVKIARVRRGQELDLDHGGLGHRTRSSLIEKTKTTPPLQAAAGDEFARNIRAAGRMSSFGAKAGAGDDNRVSAPAPNGASTEWSAFRSHGIAARMESRERKEPAPTF